MARGRYTHTSAWANVCQVWRNFKSILRRGNADHPQGTVSGSYNRCKYAHFRLINLTCAQHHSSPGSLSHLGTFPGSDLVGLAAGVCADVSSCSSCEGPLVSECGSWPFGGSSEMASLQEGRGDWRMQLRWEKKREKMELLCYSSLPLRSKQVAVHIHVSVSIDWKKTQHPWCKTSIWS